MEYKLVANATCDWGITPLWWVCNKWYEAINDKWYADERYCACKSWKASCNQTKQILLDIIENEYNKAKWELAIYKVNRYDQNSINQYNILVTKANLKQSEYNQFLSNNCTCIE